MKVGILTYPVPHLKTQQVVMPLMDKHDVTLIKVPFTNRPKRKVLIEHRPNQFTGPDLSELSKVLNLPIRDLSDPDWHKDLDISLICGAGIIPEEYIIPNFIINCHAGLIPMARGLDSFKWAILKGYKIGNTLHYIDKNVDKGEIISHVQTYVFSKDTINTLAKRHYESEIHMLVNFDYYLRNNKIMKLPENSPTMRMKIEDEIKTLELFEDWKRGILDNAVH